MQADNQASITLAVARKHRKARLIATSAMFCATRGCGSCLDCIHNIIH